VDYEEVGDAMITGVTIHGEKRCVFSSDADMDALGYLEQMARKGVNAFGFRIGSRVILFVGDSLRTVIVEACETRIEQPLVYVSQGAICESKNRNQ
jgi:hypothetical protein